MTDFEFIEIDDRSDGVAVLTLRRPDQLNALNNALLIELFKATKQLSTDTTLRAVVITGAGRAFVAGADIAAMDEMSEEEAASFGRQGHQTMNAIESLPVPVIAAVNGFALGGGLELALSCDLIYLSDKARVGLPEVGLGIIPGFGGTQRLGRRIGWQQARRLVFTGDTLSAEEAHQIGLAVDVFAGDDLLDEVFEIASTIALQGPVAVRRAKSIMKKGAHLPLREANELEIQAFGDLWDTDDRAEGMRAFLEKRAPDFQGK